MTGMYSSTNDDKMANVVTVVIHGSSLQSASIFSVKKQGHKLTEDGEGSRGGMEEKTRVS